MPRRSCLVFFLLLILAGSGQGSTENSQGPVYLVFAGPFSSSPSSAFGHLFLVFQSDLDLPLPLWDVVSFNAKVLDEGPLRFYFIGITGGFLGSYKTIPFHQQAREYEVLEDRDLWLYQLRLSSQDRDNISATLAEVEIEQVGFGIFLGDLDLRV